MSQENVDLVLGLYPGPALDLAILSRDGELTSKLFEQGEALFRTDCECVVVGLRGDDQQVLVGLDQIRSFWLAWLAPWQMFRVVVEDAVDLGDRVVVMHEVFGRTDETTPVEKLTGTDIWTVSDGRIARVEFHAERAAALRAAGLED